MEIWLLVDENSKFLNENYHQFVSIDWTKTKVEESKAEKVWKM